MTCPIEWTRNAAVTNSVVDAISEYTGATLGGTPGTAAASTFPGGFLRGAEISNPNGADVFVQVFGQIASSVTLGSTKPVRSIRVPANGSVELEDSYRTPLPSGLSLAATATEEGSGAPAGALTVRLSYEGG